MLHYFSLQYTMTNRRLKDAGLPPAVAYALLAVAFVGLSAYLFHQTAFAPYIYTLSALMLISRLSDTKRNEFLRICFPSDAALKRIRVIENLIPTVPFMAFLAFRQQFIWVAILAILAILLAIVHFRTTLQIHVWTPFSKNPFEFTVGFRNTFYLILAAYALNFVAIYTHNFNLGIFALLLVFATTVSYYTKPENEYYIWIHRQNTRDFLWYKIKIALQYSAFVALPVAAFLLLFFSEKAWVIGLFWGIGWAFLVCAILSKYALYPDETNIVQGLLLALCVWFPPLLLILIPYLFYKSQKRIGHLLK